MGRITKTKSNKNPFVDDRLSLRARGLLAMLANLPEDFDAKDSAIVERMKEGNAAYHSAIKELSENGYLTRTVVRNEHGNRFTGSNFDIRI